MFGEKASRDVWVCGAGAYIVLKALAFDGRGANKDAYDLYYVLRSYGAGAPAVGERFRPLLGDEAARRALHVLRRDFTDPASIGPRRVAEFVVGAPHHDTQADVVGFVRRFLAEVEL